MENSHEIAENNKSEENSNAPIEQALNWDYINNYEIEPPELILKLTTKDLATTSLQICFWGVHSTEPIEKTDKDGNIIKIMDNHIAGECYISLNRIFSL